MGVGGTRPRAISLLLLGTITLAIGAPALFAGRTWYPWDYYTAWKPANRGDFAVANRIHQDIFGAYWPYDRFYSESLHRNEMPWWNPNIFCGYPQHADYASSVYYPLKLLLFRLVPLPTAHTLYLMIHLFLAGWAMWELARRLELSNPASLMAAVGWMLCGTSFAWFKYAHAGAVMAALPAALVFLHDRRPWAAGLALGLGALGGTPPLVVYMGVAFVIIGWGWKGREFWRPAFGIAALCLLVSAPQVLATAELLRNGWRPENAWGEWYTNPWRLPGILLTAVFPRLFGWPTDRAYLIPELFGTNTYEYNITIGLVLAAFLFLGMTRLTGVWRCIAGMTWLSLAAATFYPLAWIVGHLPILGIANVQRLTFLFCFGAILLAARGLSDLPRLMSRHPDLVRRISIAALLLAGLGVAAAAALLLHHGRLGRWMNITNPQVYPPLLALAALGIWLRYGNSRPWIVPIMVVAELLPLFMLYNPTASQKEIEIDQSWLRTVETRPAGTRVLDATTLNWFQGILYNSPSAFGVPTPAGYASITVRSYSDFLRSLPGAKEPGRAIDLRPLSFEQLKNLGVHYVLRDDGILELSEVTSRTRGPVVVWSHDGAQHLRFDTDGPAGSLVLLDVAYPGWNATVDGTPQPILSNGPFRRLDLTPGLHRIEMRYRPTTLWIGLALAATGCLAAVLWAWRGASRERTRP